MELSRFPLKLLQLFRPAHAEDFFGGAQETEAVVPPMIIVTLLPINACILPLVKDKPATTIPAMLAKVALALQKHRNPIPLQHLLQPEIVAHIIMVRVFLTVLLVQIQKLNAANGRDFLITVMRVK